MVVILIILVVSMMIYFGMKAVILYGVPSMKESGDRSAPVKLPSRGELDRLRLEKNRLEADKRALQESNRRLAEEKRQAEESLRAERVAREEQQRNRVDAPRVSEEHRSIGRADQGKEGASPPMRPRDQVPNLDRTAIQKDIQTKLRQRVLSVLKRLRGFAGIQVRMGDSNSPAGVGIPADLFFDSGVSFRRESAELRGLLRDLVFSLSASQVLILPEGAVTETSKIMDMRRTMGISSDLMAEGVSSARLHINLQSSQISIPHDLRSFRGILFVFVYDRPLSLVADGGIGTEAGPQLSLGVNPKGFSAVRGEGAVVEFSVIEPPSGLLSWQWQLLGPDQTIIQQVTGSAPVYHQVYWSGRQNHFGAAHSSGRYEAVLTATDTKGRTRTTNLWITLGEQ